MGTFYWLSCSQDLDTVQLGGVQFPYHLETYIPKLPFQERNMQRPLDHIVKKMTYLKQGPLLNFFKKLQVIKKLKNF